MNQKGRQLAEAIEKEVGHWPEVKVTIVEAAKHPKAKLEFGGMLLSVTFSGTTGDSFRGVHNCLSDVRKALKKLGAKRDKPEPTKDEDEAPYHKANEGAAKRPDPVKGEKAKARPDVADQLVDAGAATPEQREAAQAEKSAATYALRAHVASLVDDDSDETDGEADREARVAAILAQVEGIVDGVYFNLPAEVYHAVPRLSASGLQKLCVSPATFWRGSWLDPDRPELDEDETKAQQLGKAYHVARLEPERFHATYVRELAKSDFPAKGFLSSDEKVKAKLKELGEQQTVTGETTLERCERLLDAGYEGTLFPLEKARWEAGRGGRIPIPAKYFDQIAQDMERIRGSGEIAELLSGGEPEVSIFWTDAHGLKMKCRCDYLTTGWWDDFKTFDNTRGKELESALADAVRYNRYHVQAVTYRDGVEAVRKGGLDIVGEATEAQRALIASIRIRPDELACWYVFQEKNGVPNLLAREFPFFDVPLQTRLNSAGATEDQIAVAEAATRTSTQLHTRARWEIDRAKRAFVLYSQAYDPGRPWFPLEAKARFSDLDFNSYWLEGKSA